MNVVSMDVVKNPAESLRRICDFLDITCEEKYIQDCAAIVDPVPSITRHRIVWTDEQINRVYTMMKKFQFYDRFTFEDEWITRYHDDRHKNAFLTKIRASFREGGVQVEGGGSLVPELSLSGPVQELKPCRGKRDWLFYRLWIQPLYRAQGEEKVHYRGKGGGGVIRKSRTLLLPEPSSLLSLRSAMLNVETEIIRNFTWGWRLIKGGAVLSK